MTVLFFCLYLACIWSMLGTEPCLASPVVLFELIHRRAAGIAVLRARGIWLREREHAVHIQGRAMRAWNCRSGNATDISLRCSGGGVMIQSSRKFPRSPPGGFSLFWKYSRSIAAALQHRHSFSKLESRNFHTHYLHNFTQASHSLLRHVRGTLWCVQLRAKEIQVSNMRTPIVRTAHISTRSALTRIAARYPALKSTNLHMLGMRQHQLHQSNPRYHNHHLQRLSHVTSRKRPTSLLLPQTPNSKSYSRHIRPYYLRYNASTPLPSSLRRAVSHAEVEVAEEALEAEVGEVVAGEADLTTPDISGPPSRAITML